MGHQTIMHGRIVLRENVDRALSYLRELKDTCYPALRAEMFTMGSGDLSYTYGELAIGFAASYKFLEDSMDVFIVKFEHLLRNIGFISAKLQMETEFYGTYNFFWRSGTGHRFLDEEDQLIATEEWYFGFGYRNQYGGLEKPLDVEDEVFSIYDFSYPVQFDPEILKRFNDFLVQVEAVTDDSVIYLEPYFKINEAQEKLLTILAYLYVHGEIEYGYEIYKGRWIKKLKHIAPLISPQQSRN